MSKSAFVIVLALVGTAHAGNNLLLEIVSPEEGTCVNNGGELFTGGFFGGGFLPQPRDIPVELRLSEPNGDPIALTFSVGDVEIFQDMFQPAAANQAELTRDLFVLPGFDLPDGAGTEIVVSASSPAGQSTQRVTFRLDREPPLAEVDLEALPDQVMCYADPPAIEYMLFDAQDQNPVAVERFEESGCQVSRIVRTTDDCGNAQELRFTTLRPPAAGALSLSVQGFVCDLDGCITRGPDATPFAPGARIGAGTAVINTDAPEGCIDSIRLLLFRDEEPPAEIGEGDGVIFVPEAPIREAGDYTIVAIVGSCQGQSVRRDLSFTVLDRPTANAGGPYRAAQGDPLMLDGSGSSAAPELGGIVEYAWDIDGDGAFDVIGEDIDQVPFDTTIGDGAYQGLLRITAGNGGVDFDLIEITVDDVHPTCDAGGPYEGVEGEPIALDGSASGPGHESDPLAAFAWDFGDGLFPQRGFGLDRPNHIFDDAGEFTVTLVVEDFDSESEPCEAQVTISDVRPVVENIFAFNAANLVEGDRVGFSAGDTRPGSPNDPITEFCWVFGANAVPPPEPVCGPALRGPFHLFHDDGPHRVCLRVRDEEPDDVAEGCVDIELADLQPTAALDGPAFASEGETVVFDATGTTHGGDADQLTRLEFLFINHADPDNPVVREIDLVQNPDQFTLEHQLVEDGAFTVRLRAHDEDSFTEAEVDILVADVAPRAALEVVYPDEERVALEGVELTLDASGSTPGSEADPIVGYRWDFGDGTTAETNVPTVRHAWPDAGNYPVQVIVVDEDDSESAANTQVTVLNVAPRIFIEAVGGDLEVGTPGEFRLVVDDVDGERRPPLIEWSMGDGTTYENRTVVRHAYADTGDYTVLVRVDHPGEPNEAAEASIEVTVTAAAPGFTLVAPDQPLDQTITGREGERLLIRIQVDSARAGPDAFDGPVDLAVSFRPQGSQSRVIDGDDPDAQRFIEVDWTPTFYQAGRHEVAFQALAPSAVQRQVRLVVEIEEAGSPLLAAAGGTASEGELTLYRYGLQNNEVTFVRFANVAVGLGATSVVPDPRDGRRVYVATPGSGGVAVVSTVGAPSLLRTVPTGAGTRAVVWGAGRVWALNAERSTLAVIDPVTLKVDRTIDLPGLDQPHDLVWLPEGFDALAADRLAVVTARGGVLALYDPAELLAGRPGEVARTRIGGVLDRVVADPETGWLAIADRKGRRVYQVSVQALIANPDDPDIDGLSTVFAPRDLAARGGVIYAATTAGIWRIGPDGAQSPPDRNVQASAVADLPDGLLTGGGVIIGEADRVYNYTGDLQRLVGAPGPRMRRLVAFVALDEDD